MDPDATMRQIVSCLATLRKGDDDEARAELVEHLRDLAKWLERGGFPPQGIYIEQGG